MTPATPPAGPRATAPGRHASQGIPPPAPRRAIGRAVLVAVAALAVAVPLLSVAGLGLPGRPVLALLYLLTVPGVAVAALLRLPGPLASGVLAVAVSLAAMMLVATAQLVSGLWSPVATQLVLSAVGLACTALELRRPDPRPGDAPR